MADKTHESLPKSVQAAFEPETSDLLHHDTRAALADVLGGLEMLSETELPDSARTQIERVRAAARQLSRLLELSTFRTDTSASEVGHPLTTLLDGIRARWAGRAEADGVLLSVELNIPDDVASVLSPLALERVLGNLLDNAMKYGDGQPITLSAEIDRDENTVTLAVSDAGPGLTSDQRSRLLEAGVRGADHNTPGSGWGLHIARELVEQAGGEITLQDAVGQCGLCVRLILPLRVLQAPAAQPVANETPLRDRSVLLVEDNPTNQIVASKMLELLGAKCTICSDGVEGADILDRQVFDIALVDIEMPRKDGLTLLTEMRDHADARVRNMPRVALTAYALPHHRKAIETAGASGIIVKPLSDIAAFGAEVTGYLQTRDRQATAAPCDTAVLERLHSTLGPVAFADWQASVPDDLSRARSQIDSGLEGGDWSHMRAGAHALISLGGMIGAGALERDAKSLHQRADDALMNGHQVAPNQGDPEISSLLERISAVEGFLKSYRDDRKAS